MVNAITGLAIAALLLCGPAAPGTLDGHAGGQQQEAPSPDKPLNINTATAEQLQAVPGIGETLARRIVEFRDEHGPFEKVDDLLNVQGIGTRSLDRMRAYLTVEKAVHAG